jgi:hypothetical protein
MQTQTITEPTDFITIIGRDMADIFRQFRAGGLADADYSIVHRIGSHRFTVVDGERAAPLFGDEKMIAATFARRV